MAQLALRIPTPSQETTDNIIKITHILGRMMVYYSREIWNRLYYGNEEDRAGVIELILTALSDYFHLPQTDILSLPLEEIDARLDNYAPGTVRSPQLSWLQPVHQHLPVEYIDG